MDVISATNSLASDIKSVDTNKETETLNSSTSTSETSIKTNSLLDSQEDVCLKPSQDEIKSVNKNNVANVNSAGGDDKDRTLENVPDLDSVIVNKSSNDNLKKTNNEIENSIDCISKTNNICDLPKLDEEKDEAEKLELNFNETADEQGEPKESQETSLNDPKPLNEEIAEIDPPESSLESKTTVEPTEEGETQISSSKALEKTDNSPEPTESNIQNISNKKEVNLNTETDINGSETNKKDEENKDKTESNKGEESKEEEVKEDGTETNLEPRISEQSSESDTSKEKDSEENQNSSKKPESIIETDTNNEEIIEIEENIQASDALSEVDDQSEDNQQENPVFVHVNTKPDGETGDKNLSADLQNETCDEIMEVSLTEEDPIGITQDNEKEDMMDFSEEVASDKETIKVVDFTHGTIASDKSNIEDELVASKGADEEICIIPDTEREISQEEKDAATAALPRGKEDATTETSMQTEEISNSIVEKTINSADVSEQVNVDEEFMASVNNTSVETTEKPQIKVTEIPEKEMKEELCHQCCSAKKCKYKVDNQNKSVIYLCTDTCLISFRTLNKPPMEGFKQPLATLKIKDIGKKVPGFVRKCFECDSKITHGDEKVLSWETMEFCNEDCLSRYQNRIGSHCANCKKTVPVGSLGKYCVRFGHDIRQFCCSLCLEEFKKGLKVCSYCQKDISGGSEGFLAPVGDKGQFKDFCSQLCMEKYDQMSNKAANKSGNALLPTDISCCGVCTIEKQVQVIFDQQSRGENKRHKFCGYPCFVAFKFVNQMDPPQCDMCKNFFENENCSKYSIYYDNFVKNFCCKTCQNIYIIANRRIVPCSWCKVKKYNFDMIKKSCANGQVLMMCSLNCLSLFQVSVNAVSSKKMRCDYCTKVSQAQYHLTMSDATIRNFCTYLCVMSFQSQFAKLPITLGAGDKPATPKPVPASGPKKYTNRATRSTTAIDNTTAPSMNEVRMPVITNVESLATSNNNGTATPRVNTMSNAVKINNQQSTPQISVPPKVEVKQQVIIKAPPLPQMKNAATSCKPILHTKGVSCRPHPISKETQTDEIKEKTIVIPVPVPIYIPSPMPMYSVPVPVPIPFPLPIPIPVFIPTTRNSAPGILKEIKKIQVKIPTDPFEAELLMMAEMVAGEKKVDNTDSESEEDDNGGDAGADGGFSPEAVDTSNTFGDDMLQMALKMATELDEPAVDLEGALTANTITANQNQDNTGAVVGTEEAVDDPQQPINQLIDRQNIPIRGRKRPNRQARNMNNPAKRGRRMSSHVEMPLLPAPQPSQPPEPIEKPDANMCLKYTFGVNAWKQWVTTKNAELEKSSRRVKLFKNEILQLTADELNYSLCLFVKEVRKPNGTEYAPDTIYYLCLGIQQYLFENGRIDNIFTDAYYEKFTDCLDEVARKFSVLYNDSHYIVTRVEEEHLWESKQLGAHSPHVLLSTLMFFNTKHFNLTTVDEHMQLSFSHIMKHWKRNPNQPGAAKIPGSRNVLLRFYPPQTTLDSNSRKKKVYEQQENEENPLRCPVKLYEFYLSKCPESVKTRNDVFYLLPERSCVPDSPVWYSTMALGREALEKMLHRVKMVKEINVALLTNCIEFESWVDKYEFVAQNILKALLTKACRMPLSI